ncbi:hypothetical protein Droror1_Dr00018101 [Drosera rotundifolia]
MEFLLLIITMMITFPCSVLVTLSSLNPFFHCQATSDTLRGHQSLSDGETLISSNNLFELGFFSPGKRSGRYVGIWYKDIVPLTAVWVANRNNPLDDFSGHLNLCDNGIMLYNGTYSLVWSMRLSLSVEKPILQLLDSGNLVFKPENEQDPKGFVWQSFDNPLDTWLPGMKLGWNVTGHSNRYLTSWISLTDPGTGEFKFAINPVESPQLVICRRNVVEYRWGPWDGVRFSGNNELKSNFFFDLMCDVNDQGMYYMIQPRDNSVISRLATSPWGSLAYLTWKNMSNKWITRFTIQGDFCDQYGTCGTNAICDMGNESKCQCLDGFIPRYPKDWDAMDWLDGCQRRLDIKCRTGEGFMRLTDIKLPANSRVLREALNMDECQETCLRDCFCMAYTYLNVFENASKCVVWYGDLLDIRVFTNGAGNELYIKMSREELASPRLNSYIAKDENGDEDVELPLFDLKAISDATNNFSSKKIISRGGFGPVYMGILSNGKEIAVKRLSRCSSQGLHEFINEVTLISKLQHRNLVKILGCCVDGEERIIILEYMPNRSLDQFLFDNKRSGELPWKKRFSIIIGVARGIIYLHEDSRYRIIHRDLKASNILLDSEMNPKVSDLGIARKFGGDNGESTTARVFGTHGYMSPEYAFSGQFSVKSDAFSFGVLTLEIISGKRNWKFRHPHHDYNLIGHAWELWRKGEALELVDEVLKDSFSKEEVLRCINVALLCVQPRPDDRPTMSTILRILQTDNNSSLLTPNEPGFCASGSAVAASSSHVPQDSLGTINMVDITTLEVR